MLKSKSLLNALLFNVVMLLIIISVGCSNDITVSSEKAITSFTIGDAEGVINGQVITITVPYDTDLTALMPVIEFSGIAVKPASGAPQDFTNPATYRVLAEDGSALDYTVTVHITIPTASEMTMFMIPAAEMGGGGWGLDADMIGVISGNTITLATQQWIENIESLKAVFESTGEVTVNGATQESGVTAQDFRCDIVYTVAAEGNAPKDYTVVFESPQTTGLPVMKIDTQGRSIVSKDEWFTGLNPGVEPSYSIYGANGELLISGGTDIKGRGGSTWDMPKKPYSLKLSSKAPLLDMPTHKRWNLLANYADKTLLRTDVAFKIGDILQSGLAWTPRSRHVQFYLNDAYQGVYQLTEAIKIDDNRVDIKDITKKNPQRGYILEVDVREGEPFHFTTTQGVVFNCSDPDEGLDDVITGDTKTLFEKIQEDVQNAEDVLYSANFDNPNDGYQKYLDVDSFVDWYLVNEITKNNDAIFFSSVYMYYDPDPDKEKYCMGPVWDFDISLGNVDYNGNDNPQGFWIKDSSWISRLFEDPSFVLKVKTRWTEKKGEFFALQQYIDEQASYLNDAQAQNFRLWDILGIIVWPNVVATGTYQGEIGYVKSWLAARLEWLDTAIDQL